MTTHTQTVTFALALGLGLAAITGCQDTSFDATTVAPPTRTAELDDENHRITVSKGVALAFECTYGYYRPCGDGWIESNDEAVAGAYNGYSEELFDVVRHSQQSGPGDQAPTRFVVVGYQPGTTTIDVLTECGDEQFRVTVLDDE